jgi:hypothetical protein
MVAMLRCSHCLYMYLYMYIYKYIYRYIYKYIYIHFIIQQTLCQYVYLNKHVSSQMVYSLHENFYYQQDHCMKAVHQQGCFLCTYASKYKYAYMFIYTYMSIYVCLYLYFYSHIKNQM